MEQRGGGGGKGRSKERKKWITSSLQLVNDNRRVNDVAAHSYLLDDVVNGKEQSVAIL